MVKSMFRLDLVSGRLVVMYTYITFHHVLCELAIISNYKVSMKAVEQSNFCSVLGALLIG